MTSLADQVDNVFRLLTKTQPVVEEYDVVWHGPYYIPRRRFWCPSRFMLYQGGLYASLFIPPSWHGLTWKLGSEQVEIDKGWATDLPARIEDTWVDALAQIERRLTSAVGDFAAYNRRVEKRLPPACRTGKIQRRLTWPESQDPPLPLEEVQRFDEAIVRGSELPALREMTLTGYLAAAGVAYEVFDELRPLPPLAKYRRRADGRHGGMLDLPPDDADAFAEWYHGRSWQGSHPWEIVFGHPHGVMFAPHAETDTHAWRYSLSVGAEGWYAVAARMAVALAEHGIPFECHGWEKMSQALRGLDDVPVGEDLRSIRHEELRQIRPDVLDEIRWDPIPQLAPITPDQLTRVSSAKIPRGAP